MTLDSLTAFKAHYPDRPAGLAHALSGHALFQLDALAALSTRLRADCLEHNIAALPIDQDGVATPTLALSADEIIRSIEDCGAWLVMKKVDQDPAYAALVDATLAELTPFIESRTGAGMRREAFIFVSSPNAVTPFHMDPEHNILFQVRGSKTMRIYPNDDETIVSQTEHEAFHRGGRHRNMRFDAAFDAVAETFELVAGQAVYVPVKAPHWVQNGPDVSISLSITWRSRHSDSRARLHRVNHRLREAGLAPGRPGEAPAVDAIKIGAHRALKTASGVARRLAGKPARERSAY